MRLFAAVWPPEHVLDHLDVALGAVRGAPSGLSQAVRWSARETWHLTTAFYGDQPDGVLPDLTAQLAEVTAGLEPYELALRGAGVFSHRTLWVGVGGDADAQRAVSAGCLEAGDVRDSRARQRAHLTIGRVRPGSRPPRRGSSRNERGRPGPEPDREVDVADGIVRALTVYEGPRWTVDDILLMSSLPGSGRGGGPLYEVVERFPLGERGRMAP